MEKHVHCEKCGRYLFTAFGSTILRIVCRNSKCKHINDIKIVSSDHTHDLTFTFPPRELTKQKTQT